MPTALKVVFIGNPMVGKTSIRRSYMGKQPNKNYRPTLGADFAQAETIINQVKTKIAIWDLSGQQRFKEAQPQYFVGSHAAIVVYDTEADNPIQNIINWIDRYIEYSGNTEEPILILQNKIDLLEPTDDVQSIADHEQLIERLNIYYHRRLQIIESRTCAISGENVKNSLDTFFRKILEHYNNSDLNRHTLNNQMENGLYTKTAYLMTFDEDYGPVILDKSPMNVGQEHSAAEMSQTVKLFSVLDFDFLTDQGFRFGIAPWPSENATMYHLAFTLPNENIRGGQNMFIIGISVGKDLSNLLAGSYNQIEGFLLNAMNTACTFLEEFNADITSDDNGLYIAETSIEPMKLEMTLYKLRLNMDRVIRELLYN